MKEIIRKQSSSTVDMDTLFDGVENGRLPKGIVAYVYKGRVSVLTYMRSFSPHVNQTSALWHEGDSFSTASETPKEVVRRSLEETSHKVYWFEDWGDFAQSVVENGWE